MKVRKNSATIYILLLVLALFAGGKGFIDNVADNNDVTSDAQSTLEINFIDVGQADSILCSFPDGKVMLVDAGNNTDGEKVCRFIEDKGIEKIDYLIGTHPHADHIGGMDDVIKTFDIGEIFMPKVSANTKTFEDVLDAAYDKGMSITAAKQGVVIDENNNFSAEFLSPIKNIYNEMNEYSTVIMIQYGTAKVLLTGDMESYNENEIAADVGADVLKVAHHGSNTSSSESFIKRVSPKIAVISVGKDNSYGHPDDKVIKRLKAAGAKILRTDQDGTVTVYSDGKNVWYRTQK